MLDCVTHYHHTPMLPNTCKNTRAHTHTPTCMYTHTGLVTYAVKHGHTHTHTRGSHLCATCKKFSDRLFIYILRVDKGVKVDPVKEQHKPLNNETTKKLWAPFSP